MGKSKQRTSSKQDSSSSAASHKHGGSSGNKPASKDTLAATTSRNNSPKNKGNNDNSTAGAAESSLTNNYSYTKRCIRLYPIEDWETLGHYARNMFLVTVLALTLGLCLGSHWRCPFDLHYIIHNEYLSLPVLASEEWQLKLAMAIRSSTFFQLATLQPGSWNSVSLESWRNVSYVHKELCFVFGALAAVPSNKTGKCEFLN